MRAAAKRLVVTSVLVVATLFAQPKSNVVLAQGCDYPFDNCADFTYACVSACGELGVCYFWCIESCWGCWPEGCVGGFCFCCY